MESLPIVGWDDLHMTCAHRTHTAVALCVAVVSDTETIAPCSNLRWLVLYAVLEGPRPGPPPPMYFPPTLLPAAHSPTNFAPEL
jgi:hypothetical protein